MSIAQPNESVPLNESLYKLDEAEYEFWSAQTGVKDPEELKNHIIAVQTEIYKVSLVRIR